MVFLLTGSNKYLKEKVKSRLLERFNKFTYILLDGEDDAVCNIAVLETLFSQPSLFSDEKKLIYIKDFTSFDDQGFLLSYIEKALHAEDFILILDSNEKLRSNAKILKIIPKEQITIANPYLESELIAIIANFLPSLSAQQYLLSCVEHDPYLLEEEAKKINLFLSISPKGNYKEVISLSKTYSIWEVLSSLFQGRKQEAVKRIDAMLSQGENEFGMLSMITWNLRIILVTKVAGNRTDTKIAKDFGYSPYSLKNARNLGIRFSLEKITHLLEKIDELELKIKSGTIEPHLGLILLAYFF